MKSEVMVKKIEKKIEEIVELNEYYDLKIFNEVGSENVINYPLYFKLYPMRELDDLYKSGVIEGNLTEIIQNLDSQFSVSDEFLMLQDNGRMTSVPRGERLFSIKELAKTIYEQYKSGETSGWGECVIPLMITLMEE